MKTNKMLAGFGLLTTAIPSVVFAQIINRAANDRPEESSKTLYIVIAVVVVLAVGGFLLFRSKGKK